jgi:chromosome segregation ATPase
MKHIKLFEQFVNEANNDKKIKDLQNDLTELNNRMEEIQFAMDKGDMDEDEAQLQLSDLDGQKVEIEGELADLQTNSKNKADELGSVKKLLDKFFELRIGTQSFKWAYMIDNVPEEEKSMMIALQKRDQQIEASDTSKAEKMVQKIEKLSKDFSEETKSYISYFLNDYKDAYLKWSQVAMTLQGANESCKDYQLNCKGVAAIKTEYSKAESELKTAKAELASKESILIK